jgi:hypothetical protein
MGAIEGAEHHLSESDMSDQARETRKCSRCRGVFPADPSLLHTGEYAWWLCDPCHDALLGSGSPKAK